MLRPCSIVVATVLLASCDRGETSDSSDAETKTKTEAKEPDPSVTQQLAQAEAEAKAAREEAKALRAKLAEAERAEAERAEAKRAAEATKPAPPTATKPSAEPAPMSRPEPDFEVLATPPFGQSLIREVVLSHQDPQPRLKKKSGKRNSITDVDAWFKANGLALPQWTVPGPRGPGDLPEWITPEYRGEPIRAAIQSAPHSVSIYSPAGAERDHVVVRDPAGDILGAFDFSPYEHSPKDVPADRWLTDQHVRWGQTADGVLYVCTNHRTYARSSGGLNAFITAIELKTGDLMWQSAPLVCNSRNFLLRDGWIITGYGFTAEPDFLYVLDARTGEVAKKVKLKSGPEVILEKGGELFVRTYDRNYVFSL